MKVMIVDDNETIHDLIRDALMPEAYDFADCTDGTEAVALYGTFEPDWVLMDIRMEKMDGMRATQAILAKDPSAKIIMITQYNEASLREKAKRIGAIECVLKENLDEIRDIIVAGNDETAASNELN